MSNWKDGDWERTQEVIGGKRVPVENGQTWLRHGVDRKDGSSYRIDLEILKGKSTVEEIARVVGCPINRVTSHLSHLQDKKDPSMEPHHLKLKVVTGIISFDLTSYPVVSEKSGEVKWSDAEYKATVEAYLWMLEQERNGKPYNKSHVSKELRDGPLVARSKPSVEFRMRNISAVMEELCLPRIKGYLPASNIGREGKEKVMFYLADAGVYNPADYAPTDNPEIFDQRVRELAKKIDPSVDPAGNKTPEKTEATVTRFVRDPAVKASVLKKAGGICEGCSLGAPFTTPEGEPFLEVHHLIQLSESGSDLVSNAVALCPNCHRRCHHSSDREVFVESIYQKVLRLVRV